MAEFVVRVGSFTAQGLRPNNEDRLVADEGRHVFLVADGMGGQEAGEEAAGLAAEIIPRVLSDRLAAQEDAPQAMQHAIEQAHQAIIDAGRKSASSRRMGTTAVLALQQQEKVWVAGVGDSPAILVRRDTVKQLTEDHTIADTLARRGTITFEQARLSPYRHVLYRFLGCTEMTEGAEVHPFTPQAGDRLVLASDGVSGVLTLDEIAECVRRLPPRSHHPQECAEALVRLSLERGSKDNVTCIVLAFDPE